MVVANGNIIGVIGDWESELITLFLKLPGRKYNLPLLSLPLEFYISFDS